METTGKQPRATNEERRRELQQDLICSTAAKQNCQTAETKNAWRRTGAHPSLLEGGGGGEEEKNLPEKEEEEKNPKTVQATNDEETTAEKTSGGREEEEEEALKEEEGALKEEEKKKKQVAAVERRIQRRRRRRKSGRWCSIARERRLFSAKSESMETKAESVAVATWTSLAQRRDDAPTGSGDGGECWVGGGRGD